MKYLIVILGLAIVGFNYNNYVIDGGINPPDKIEVVIEETSRDDEYAIDSTSVEHVVLDLISTANIQIKAPMCDKIPVEMTEAYIGLTIEDFETYVVDSVFYESMISPSNQSFCIIKVNDASKVEELKQKIFDNCNPRKWICVTAERVIVLNSGEYIMLAMASQDSCNALVKAFEVKFDKENVGTILDKTVFDSIDDFE